MANENETKRVSSRTSAGSLNSLRRQALATAREFGLPELSRTRLAGTWGSPGNATEDVTSLALERACEIAKEMDELLSGVFEASDDGLLDEPRQ